MARRASFAALGAFASLAALICLSPAVALASCSGRSRQAARADEVPESRMGKIYGEFEDARLLEESLDARPEMRSWSERQLMDGLSGATIQAKTFGKSVPDRVVTRGGKVLAYADGFGQYWLALPPGSCELVGRCKGYRDAKATVVVASGAVTYLNFRLERR